jgi:hypothetical protein
MLMQVFIVVAILGLIGMLIGVWKIREIKAEFESRNRERIQEIFASLDRMECLGDVQRNAEFLVLVMKRCRVKGVIAPLGSGALVQLKRQGDALSICSA